MASEFRLNDVGSTLDARVEEDGSAMDLSTATAITFRLHKPSGTILERAGIVVGDGSAGRAKYVFAPQELNEAGEWRFEVYVVMPSGAWLC
jgi:hypothetical protein